ncbi:MAG: DUF1727 domain-containing protein [Actinobacteria bacterium]|nr:DUF1727 domain-containing protein [Actinomycetota bacterium]
MGVRTIAAATAGRSLRLASRLARRGGGTSIGGLATVWIDRDYVPAQLNGLASLALITGTNGKTTTTALVTAAVRAAGRRVVTNHTGSNLERGVAAALLADAGWTGKIPRGAAVTGVIEADEWAFVALYPRLRPTAIVLLNLFRDQLDRYGEVDRTSSEWGRVLAAHAHGATLIVNADDPVLVAAARRHRGPVRTFGIDAGPSRPSLEEWADVRRCPLCDARLAYVRVTFAHLGHYHCPSCDLVRPAPDVRASAVELQGLSGARVTITSAGEVHSAPTTLPGIYNVYNLLAAVATSEALGVPLATAAASASHAGPAFGRAETIRTPGVDIVVLLVKNPAGANQTLDVLAGETVPYDALVLLNDGIADGRDVSWIWDVDFERLRPRRLTVGGARAHDLALRLKYAGVAPTDGGAAVAEGIAAPLDAALARANGRLVVLATYTAMLALRAECDRRGWTAPYWRVRR